LRHVAIQAIFFDVNRLHFNAVIRASYPSLHRKKHRVTNFNELDKAS